MFENYADTDSPVTKENWRKLSEFERLELVRNRITENKKFQIIQQPLSALHRTLNEERRWNTLENIQDFAYLDNAWMFTLTIEQQ